MKNIKPFKISFITAFIVTLIFSLVVIITPSAKPLVGVEISDEKVAIKDEEKDIENDEKIDDEEDQVEEPAEKPVEKPVEKPEDKEDKDSEKPVENKEDKEDKEDDDLITNQESESSIKYPSTPDSTAVYFGRTFAEVDMDAIVLFDTEIYTGPAKPSDSNDFKVKSEVKEGTELKVVGISTNEFLRIEMSDGSIAFLDAKAAKEK